MGRHLSDRQASQLAAAILDVLNSADMENSRYGESVNRTEKALVAFGVSSALAQKVAERLAAVRQTIGAPEDIPLVLPK